MLLGRLKPGDIPARVRINAIQEMVDNSIRVHCVKVNNGWQEIDTPEDFENAIQKNEKAKN